MIDSLVWKTVSNYNSNDPLEQCLLYDSFTKDENPEVAMCAQKPLHKCHLLKQRWNL